MDKARRVGLVLAAVGGLLGCTLSEDQKAAVDTCRHYGNDSKPCAMANRMLESGAQGIAKALQAEAEAQAVAEQAEVEAAAREAELAAAGIDPCDALREQLTAQYPGEACAEGLAAALQWLADDPGCAAALEDPEGTTLTAADLVGDCASQ